MRLTVGETLVSVSKISGKPDGSLLLDPGRPLSLGEGERLVRPVLGGRVGAVVDPDALLVSIRSLPSSMEM